MPQQPGLPRTMRCRTGPSRPARTRPVPVAPRGSPGPPLAPWSPGLMTSPEDVIPLGRGGPAPDGRAETLRSPQAVGTLPWGAPPGALTRHAQLLRQPPAKGLGTEHTLIHGDAPHGHEGAHVQGAHPGVLPCRDRGRGRGGRAGRSEGSWTPRRTPPSAAGTPREPAGQVPLGATGLSARVGAALPLAARPSGPAASGAASPKPGPLPTCPTARGAPGWD